MILILAILEGLEEQKMDESINGSQKEDKKAVEDLGKTSKTNNSYLSILNKN